MSQPIPMHQAPVYICHGFEEPFMHYALVEGSQWHAEAVYTYAGECRQIEHPLGYPHYHQCDER